MLQWQQKEQEKSTEKEHYYFFKYKRVKNKSVSIKNDKNIQPIFKQSSIGHFYKSKAKDPKVIKINDISWLDILVKKLAPEHF